MFWVRYIKGNKVELMCTSYKVFQRSSRDRRRQAPYSGDDTGSGAEAIAGNPVGSGGWETGLFPEPCDSVCWPDWAGPTHHQEGPLAKIRPAGGPHT